MIKRRAGGGGEGGLGRSICAWKLTILLVGEGGGNVPGAVGGGGGRALGRIYVAVCNTRGARSRRWCGWWGRRGR